MNKELKLLALEELRKELETKRQKTLQEVDEKYQALIQPLKESCDLTKQQFNETYDALMKYVENWEREIK